MAAVNPAIGSWARSQQACGRPELVLRPNTAAIQSDADGSPVVLDYSDVKYRSDGHGQITVELGGAHPYGRTASRNALSFKPRSADEIALVQGKRLVAFHRCGPGSGYESPRPSIQGASR